MPLAVMFFNHFCLKSIGLLLYALSMTVQSLKTKTIGKSSLNLEYTQALKMGGVHLGNKMANVTYFFQKLSCLTMKHRKPEDDTLNCFAVMRKSGKRRKKKKNVASEMSVPHSLEK